MKESSLYLRFFGLFLVWVQLAQPIWAVTYTYVFTYGGGDYVCHARLEVYVNSQNPASTPEVTLRSVFCAPAAGGSRDVYDVPVAGQNGATTGAGAYILDLGPVNRNGHRGFEIGINQAAQSLPGNRRIPILFPRVNLYTDTAGEPLGVCSYRQGAIAWAQNDGTALRPYYRCPLGSTLERMIGIWRVCQLACSKF